MAEILPIHGGSIPGDPCDDIVRELERLLEEARRGELTGFAYATVRPGLVTGTGWEGAAGTRFPLFAAINVLQYRYTEAVARGDD